MTFHWGKTKPTTLSKLALIFTAMLLTGSLLSGMLFVEDMFAQHLWHKTVLTFLSWLAVLWALFVWLLGKQRGMQLVYKLMLAYGLLLAGYVLSNVILQFVIK